MKVRALKSFASALVVASPGLEFDCPDDVALAWLKAGMVERVVSEPELAVMPAGGEHAVTRGKR